MHGVMGVLILSIIAKLSKWDESAMYFDGGSLGMHFPVELEIEVFELGV